MQNENTIFTSSNMLEGGTIATAIPGLDSKAHLELRNYAKEIGAEITGKHVTVTDAIGEWKDGAEDSLIVISTANSEQAKYISALLGKRAHQKMVLSFVSNPTGKDALWKLEFDLASRGREALDSAGIEYRTFNDRTFYVFDNGAEYSDKMEHIRANYGAYIEYKAGSGEFIGAETRSAATIEFDRIIRQFQTRYSTGENRESLPTVGRGFEHYYSARA